MTRSSQQPVLFLERFPRLPISVNETNGAGPLLHSLHKVEQVLLVGMGGVTPNGGDTGPNGVPFAIKLNPSMLRPVFLDGAAGRSDGLVADKQHMMSRVFNHGFEVVDHPTPGCHAAGGEYYRRATGFGEIVDGLQVLVVAVDGIKVVEAQGVTAGFDAFLSFGVPEGFEFAVDLGEFGRER